MSLHEKQKNKIQNDSVQLFSLTGIWIYGFIIMKDIPIAFVRRIAFQ